MHSVLLKCTRPRYSCACTRWGGFWLKITVVQFPPTGSATRLVSLYKLRLRQLEPCTRSGSGFVRVLVQARAPVLVQFPQLGRRLGQVSLYKLRLRLARTLYIGATFSGSSASCARILYVRVFSLNTALLLQLAATEKSFRFAHLRANTIYPGNANHTWPTNTHPAHRSHPAPRRLSHVASKPLFFYRRGHNQHSDFVMENAY